MEKLFKTISLPLPAIGDALWATPVCYLCNATIELPDNNFGKKVAALFDGIAYSVVFKQQHEMASFNNPQNSRHTTHDSFEKLGLTGSIIPKINISSQEYEWAKSFLKSYNNPIAIINDNSGCSDKNNWCANVIRPPTELVQSICDYLVQKNHTMLQFGVSNGFYGDGRKMFTPLTGAIPILDLTLRQMAACYKVIGKIITGETGHPHLMAAVGGKVVDIVPDYVKHGINLGKSIFTNEDWLPEKPRIKYVCYENFSQNYLKEILDFNF